MQTLLGKLFVFATSLCLKSTPGNKGERHTSELWPTKKTKNGTSSSISPMSRFEKAGVGAVGVGFPILGFFFDYRGANVEIWDHILGIFFAGAIAFSVGWHDEYGRRKR